MLLNASISAAGDGWLVTWLRPLAALVAQTRTLQYEAIANPDEKCHTESVAENDEERLS